MAQQHEKDIVQKSET